ncbi:MULTISPECIES: metallophosphoesterase [Bhargavaea]|uniref:Metallophosphoesterase n=1 Tax=Bhargavaea changchunensis TaxID=2134037 RepID=A0ABW2NGH2_9BACL|nr:metallophosphoesterase [Bhargavaea sp. CC-171006]
MELKTVGAVLAAAAGTVLAAMYASAKVAILREHDAVIHTEQDGEGPKILFISDIHRRRVSRKLIRKAGGPFDAVVIGGDLAEGGVPESRIRLNIRRLSALGPLFYVWGNNDREVGEALIRSVISDEGGTVLDNESAELMAGPIRWMLVGTDDETSSNVDVDQAFRNVRRGDAVIFVSHSPSVFRMLGSRDPEVRMAGHTHGGQIRLGRFGMLEKGFFRSDNGKVELVSNGYGTSLVPLRLGAPAECHVIRLRAKKKHSNGEL